MFMMISFFCSWSGCLEIVTERKKREKERGKRQRKRERKRETSERVRKREERRRGKEKMRNEERKPPKMYHLSKKIIKKL